MISTIKDLVECFRKHGAIAVYAKRLASNDNSKNQIYLGGSEEVFSIMPPTGIAETRQTKRGVAYRATLNFFWITQDGHLCNAPSAQLIYYPQYPEIRLSGFLQGCDRAPNTILASRDQGRVLFSAVTGTGAVLAFACDRSHPISKELEASRIEASRGVFIDVLALLQGANYSRKELMQRLCGISKRGWIRGVRLRQNGERTPSDAPQAGGYTLEAELGIAANSFSEPDYYGWEIKSYTVQSLESPRGKAITLMTPEPDGGLYVSRGPEFVIRKYGYEDRRGRPDRLNLGGIFRIGHRHGLTGLTMVVRGVDVQESAIVDPDACIALNDGGGNDVASWSLAGLLDHWRRKHSNAVYVPCISEQRPSRHYCYGNHVEVGTGAKFILLIQAFVAGVVYYDPGIKLECASSLRPKLKRRSQFRVTHSDLGSLYEAWERTNACDDG